LVLAVIAIVRSSDKSDSEIVTSTQPSPPPVTETTTVEITTVTTALTTAAVTEESPESSTDVSESITAAPAAVEYDKEFFTNYLFIGDSISTGLYGYNYLDAANVFAKIGFTPENVRTGDINGTTVYQKLAVAKPEAICIMLGTNGLSYISTETMINHYGLFIDEIRDILPDSKIIVFTIPPVTKEHEETKPENLALITAFNEGLATLADEKEVQLFDVYSMLADNDGYTKPEYAEFDGLHLKGAAYTLILSELQALESAPEQ
jgi:lysophospholipase L1-like esterase